MSKLAPNQARAGETGTSEISGVKPSFLAQDLK
jgi:hypothetical protein